MTLANILGALHTFHRSSAGQLVVAAFSAAVHTSLLFIAAALGYFVYLWLQLLFGKAMAISLLAIVAGYAGFVAALRVAEWCHAHDFADALRKAREIRGQRVA